MTTRIVITGNCHAQYYAAALQSLGIAETRCVGRPFAGPIQFRGTTARFLQPSEVSEWLEQSNAHHRIIVRQTTPLGRYQDQDKKLNRIPGVKIVNIPYVKFETFLHRTGQENSIRSLVRGDKIFNEMSLAKADIDRSAYDRLLSVVAQAPSLYTRNHFSGRLFAELLDISDFAAALPAGDYAQLVESIRSDAGISHDNSGVPSPECISAMNITWMGEHYAAAMEGLGKVTVADLAARPIAKTEALEFFLYAHWRKLFHLAQKRGDRAALLKCLMIYRSENRFYRPWFRNIAELLLGKKKAGLAARLAADRMAQEDPRALFLEWALEHRPVLQASAAARGVFRLYGARGDGSNAGVFANLLEAFDK